MENLTIDTLEKQIFYWAEKNPAKKAIIYGEKSLTYKELINKSLAAKKYLSETLWIKRGDRIVLAATKELGFIYAYLGAHMLGVITIPIDPDISSQRLELILGKTDPVQVFGNLSINSLSFSKFEDLEISENVSENFDMPVDAEIADILFTSGTTGEPKGVVLTNENIFASAVNINSFIKNTCDDIELLALPIGHSFGLGRLRCTLIAGATLVLFGSFAHVKKLFAAILDYKITGLGMVPSSWAYLYKFSGSKIASFASQLKYIELGSSFMSIENKKLLMSLLPDTRICMHYGLTEASRSTFIEFHSEESKLDSIGRATPNVEVEVINEKGEILGNNLLGEICIKGKNVMKGYWVDSPNNSNSVINDFFRTGDLGYNDSEGYFYLTGRKNEMINVGGKKVSSLEVEAVLLSLEGIKECACIGIDDPNEILGEVIKAFIVPVHDNISLDEIAKQTLTKLEPYKCPVEYEIINEIPKTKSGKIERFKLKDFKK